MSIFWGVNFPPPQKYTSLERVVTTAIGVSVTVLSLCCNQDNTSVTHYKIVRGSSKRRTWSKLTTYFGFLIAEFSRATRSSSSLPQNDAVSGSSEFITSNRNWNTFLIRKFQKPFSLSINVLFATGDDWLVQNLLGCRPVGRILQHKKTLGTLQRYSLLLTLQYCFWHDSICFISTPDNTAFWSFPRLTWSRHSYTSLIKADE